MIKVVIDDINKRQGTDYRQKDVYFDFNREIITNASDNASIKKIEADTKQVEINTLLGLTNVLDNETVIQMICENLDIDYETIKDKLPRNEVEDSYNAMGVLNNEPPTNSSSEITTQ